MAMEMYLKTWNWYQMKRAGPLGAKPKISKEPIYIIHISKKKSLASVQQHIYYLQNQRI